MEPTASVRTHPTMTDSFQRFKLHAPRLTHLALKDESPDLHPRSGSPCDPHATWYGTERSRTAGTVTTRITARGRPGPRFTRSATQEPDAGLVVRGRIELPTFRFSDRARFLIFQAEGRRPDSVRPDLEPAEQPLRLATPPRLTCIAALDAPAAGLSACTRLPAPSWARHMGHPASSPISHLYTSFPTGLANSILVEPLGSSRLR